MEVALFMQSRESKQGFVYIPLNGRIWTPSMDEISQLRRVYGQDFETKARNARSRSNPRRALRENEPGNGEIIDLTLRLPEPPPFVPTQRAVKEEKAEVYIKEEEAEVYIKEEEKDGEGQY